MAISSATSVEPSDRMIEFIGEAQVVRALLDDDVVLHRPVEEQELRRQRERVELGLEAGQDRPQDREEDDEADDPGERRS